MSSDSGTRLATDACALVHLLASEGHLGPQGVQLK